MQLFGIFLCLLFGLELGLGVEVLESFSFPVLKSANLSTLHYVNTSGSFYSNPILIARLKGSHFQIGYDYASLLSEEIIFNYNAFFAALNPQWSNVTEKANFEALLDGLYVTFFATSVPEGLLKELEGVDQSGRDQGIPDLGNYIRRLLATTSISPTDSPFPVPFIVTTSAMGAFWGSRTQGGRVLSVRNLSFAKTTGLSDNKVIVIYEVENDTSVLYRQASIGFAGLFGGSLIGINEKGASAHETDIIISSEAQPFVGLPWTMGIRTLLEKVSSQEDAADLLDKINPVQGGFIIGIASNASNSMIIAEMMLNKTVLFTADSPVEANATLGGVQIGYPLPEALYRSNFAFDPSIRAYQFIETDPNNTYFLSDSLARYKSFHTDLSFYETEGILIGPLEALNITANSAGRGANLYSCNPANTVFSFNIISTLFDVANLEIYVAYENGNTTETWTPAACNPFVKIDLTPFFADPTPEPTSTSAPTSAPTPSTRRSQTIININFNGLIPN